MIFNDSGIFGFDVSFYQDNNQTPQKIDFVKMKNYGASFVIIKVGQNTYKDEDFLDNWANAKEAGLPRGAYWFLDILTPGKSQAQTCWNLLKNDPPEGPIFVDFEKDLRGMIPSWNEVYNFISELQFLSGFPNNKLGIYTGYYIWKDYGPVTKEQRDWFKKYILWLAWYSGSPTNVLLPYPWTECVIWQDGTPSVGIAAGVESLEIDHNKFNGDLIKFSQIFSTPVPQVIHTQPHPGFDEYVEIVNNEKCHISIIDMAKRKMVVRHFDGYLGKASSVGKEANVICAFNGEDYDKNAPIKYYPKHLTYVDGIRYTSTMPEASYYLDFSKTKQITSGSSRISIDFWNTTSFIRPLVVNGALAQDMIDNPTKIEYTEIHAFSGLGYTRDGKLIQIVAEGKVNPLTGVSYRGIKLPQLANLFIKYGAIFAGQHGGGGDSVKIIDGIVVNEFSDPTERPVVQVIEIIDEGVNNMNGTAKEKLGNTSTVRMEPSRYGADTGKRIYPYSTIEFTQIVPATVKGTADSVNDKWFKLPDGTYVNYTLAGKEYYTVLTLPSEPDPTLNDVFEVYRNGQLILRIVGKVEVLVQ